MCSLGEVVMLSHVRVQEQAASSDTDVANSNAAAPSSSSIERHERLLMLFPGVLLMLSVTARVSGYIYKVH